LDSASISLAQNESAFPPSDRAIKAGQQALSQSSLYPDPDWAELRDAISTVHSISTNEILCGAGSMELIAASIRAYAGVGDEVLSTDYSYLFVATVCQQIGASFVQVPEANMTVSIDALLNKVSDKTRIVFVCNPGNPTGTRIPNTELLKLREQLPPDIVLLVDQAYAEFDPQDHTSIFKLLVHENTIVTRTFSKAYCLAGERIGWGAFPAVIATEVRKLLNPNNISSVAQAMATAAMLDQPYLAFVVEKTAALRQRFQLALNTAGLATPDSYTNFVLLPFRNANQANSVDGVLQKMGYRVRNMSGYGLSHCLRITVGPQGVMDDVTKLLSKEIQRLS